MMGPRCNFALSRRMSNPYQPPSYDPKQFQDQPYMPVPVIDTGYGYVSQVRVVAILNCVQGGLELAIGIMLIAVAIIMPIVMGMEQNRQANPPPEEMRWFVGGLYGVMGGLPLIAGVLRIVAGIANFRFRGRTMGLISFVVGLVSMTACYCAPTSIAVLVYGLIIYLNPAVKAAFDMGQQGMSGDRILASFAIQRGVPGTTPFGQPQQPMP
jgi:hypothetical protein